MGVLTDQLTLHAPIAALRSSATTGAEPAPTGEVNGEPITAGALRALLDDLDSLCPGGLQTPTGGSLHLALTDPDSGALRAVVTRRELERLAARGCPTHPAGDCGCPLLTAPPPVDRYRPSAGQHLFISPGPHLPPPRLPQPRRLGRPRPRPPARRGRRHRLRQPLLPLPATSPAQDVRAGWSFVMDDDGTLTVTTPTGVTRVTRPPGLLPDTEGDPAPPDDPPPF